MKINLSLFLLTSIVSPSVEGRLTFHRKVEEDTTVTTTTNTTTTGDDEETTVEEVNMADVMPIEDFFLTAGTMPICDEFTRANGDLGSEWAQYPADLNGLRIRLTFATRNNLASAQQWADYTQLPMDPDNRMARVKVTLNDLGLGGVGGVALRLGNSGTDSGRVPTFALVSSETEVYAVCSDGTTSPLYVEGDMGRWGSGVISVPGVTGPNALGTEPFTMQAGIDPLTKEAVMVLTNIVEGEFAESSIIFSCGVWDDYNVTAGPYYAGVSMYASSVNYVTIVDDFAHSGCGTFDESENDGDDEEDCEPCSTFFLTGSRMFFPGPIDAGCVEACIPTVAMEASRLVGGFCGEC